MRRVATTVERVDPMASDDSDSGLVADPEVLLERLKESGWERDVIASLIYTEDEARDLIKNVLPSMGGFDLHLLTGSLMEWIERHEVGLRRRSKAMAQRASQPRLTRDEPAKDPGDIFEALLAENIELARSVYRSRHKRALQLDGASAAGVEEAETRRWALSVAKLIKEAELPAVEIAQNTADPVATWIRLCGNRRARTLRSAARTWARFAEWLGLAFNEAWPTSVARLVDYMEERAQEGCGHTFPSSLLTALQLIETVGGVPRSERLGLSSSLINVARNLGKQLMTDALPKKTAPLFTVAMVLAAELLVVDGDACMVARVLAFFYLVMVWGALRTDDVLWLDRSRFILSEIGLRGVLLRTKTSGAGRRVRELPVFVIRTASLSGCDWLRVGTDLYYACSGDFPGVQCLCVPKKDGSGFTRKYLVASTLTGWMHWLVAQLMVPLRGRQGSWVSGVRSLVPQEMVTRWTGHSARHCLPSWAAALGIDGERRAFIGRWRAGVEVDHNTYVLTARQVVHGVQEEVLKAFCTGRPRHYVEVELLDEMVKHAESRGIDGKEVVKSHMIWKRRDRTVALLQDYPMIEDEAWNRWASEPGGDGSAAVPVVVAEEEADVAPYWVSISRKTGFERLHKTNGCGIRPESVHRSEPVFTIDSKVADKKCQLCWRPKQMEATVNDTSSESSSSTESETAETSGGDMGYELL